MKRIALRLLVLCVPLLLSACATSSGNDDLVRLDARFRSAYERRATTDAATALAAIAARFPTALSRYSDEAIQHIASRHTSPPASEKARRELLRQLFAQHWKYQSGVEPSSLWLDLAAFLVESGLVSDAVPIVPRIQTTREMVELRVDKRFESLLRMSAPVPSIESIARLDVEKWREATAKSPRSLEDVLGLGEALQDAGEYQQAVDILDAAIAKIAAAKSPSAVYDDTDEYLSWIYNSRADSLRRLGRWADAEAALRKSMETPEPGGRRNISNTINLAGFYALTGRPDDAVTTLGPLATGDTTRVSSYGVIQVKSVLSIAAVIRKDEASINSTFEYLSKHRADDPNAYQTALLWMNRGDDWSRYMIERLRDPERRIDALRDLQIYAAIPLHPAEIETEKRRREFADRPDVRAAVAEVGVIEHFSIPPP